MDIGAEHAFNDSEAADVHIFTDGVDHILQLSFYGVKGFIVGQSLQSFYVSGLIVNDNIQNTLNECLESVVLGNEVGFCVYFDNSGNIILNHDVNNAFSGDTAGFLVSLAQTLFSQDLDSFVEVTVGFNESLLAVHHTNTGLGSQVIYHLCSNSCHFYILRI